MGANCYRLSVSKNGAAAEPITVAWSTQPGIPPRRPRPNKWVTITPASGTDAYAIPAEYGHQRHGVVVPAVPDREVSHGRRMDL